MVRGFLTAAVVVFLAAATPAHAELVFFQSGRAMSVMAIRSDGNSLVLQLRNGGEVRCDASLIVRVEPDEIDYPDEVIATSPTQSLREPAAIPPQYRNLVTAAAAKHGVDARVVDAIIQVESAYHSRALSSKGARGLMQLMPVTGRKYGALDLFDPRINLDAGIQHLKTLLARYDLPLALAAYNAGEAAVDRFGGIPPFKETQDYVARVLRLVGHS
jgi:hypothetical protein